VERLTVRQLEYIVAVGEHGSFSKAARACFVAQPSLSSQVAKAEAALGVTLFERHPRSVSPTAAGQVAIARARAALTAVDAVAESARWGHVLRIGAIETVGPYLFGPWLARARTALPQVAVRPSVGRTASLLEDLAAGDLDVAVLAAPVPQGVHQLTLGSDPLLLAAPAHERLPDPLPLEELARHEMLLLADGHCLRDQALDVCAAAGASGPYAPLPGATLETLVEMAASGLGCTLVPRLALPSFTGRADVQLAPFAPHSAPSRTLVLCTAGPPPPPVAALAALAATLVAGR